MKIQLFFVFLSISLIFAAVPNKPVVDSKSVSNSIIDVCGQISKDACFLFKDACIVKNNKCVYNGPLSTNDTNVKPNGKIPPVRDICTEIPIYLCLLTKGACYIKNNKCLNPILCEIVKQC